MTFSRSQFLAISSLFLLVWFRFESSFHSHFLLNLLGPLIAVVLFFVLWKSPKDNNRLVLGVLWMLITAILITDCVQTALFSKYSDARFEKKIHEVTEQVKNRTREQLETLSKSANNVKKELEAIDILNPSGIFIHLQNHLASADYNWAVYDAEGELIAWKGEFPPHEAGPANVSEEITVFNALHQQFLRLKRNVVAKQLPFILVVSKPIAADYGMRNRYLSAYNLLTDDLSIRPDLLYNSQVVAPKASDLAIQTFHLNSEFSVSVLFKRHQYGEFLQNQQFHIHWWFELGAILYLTFGVIYCFFSFIGISGQNPTPRSLWRSWSFIFLLSFIGLVLVSEISSFGTSSIFKTRTVTGFEQRLNTPGGLLLGAFFALNVFWSFALLLWKLRPTIPAKSRILSFAFFTLASMIAAMMIQKYMGFVQGMLLREPVNPMDFNIVQTDYLKIIQWVGLLWLDLSFLVFLSVLFAAGLFCIGQRGIKQFSIVLLLQIASGSIFLIFLEGHVSVPLIVSLIIYFGIAALVFYLPALARRFGNINLFSRFLIALLVFSFVSFLFYFTRFHFAGDTRKDYVEQSARQVQNQDQVIQTTMAASRTQLDQALATLSIDPKIPDLAFRLWTRTDLRRNGFRSSLEIYDEQGRLVNRFSVNLPRLPVPILDAVLEGGWGTERRYVVLGNVRKPVHFAVREIPNVGFLVIEVAQDYENLPFMAPSNPFQELFRLRRDVQSRFTPDLNVYDTQWRPVFVSRADLSLSTQKGQDLLRESVSGWVREKWSDRVLDVYYFRISNGSAALLLPAVSVRSHFVHLIDLLLVNLVWLSLFSLVFLIFFRQYLVLHFPAQSVAGFNFFQKLLIAFMVFSMVPILSFSLVMRNYAWEKKIQEVTSRALDSFSVATKVVGDYLFYRAEEQDVSRQQLFSNELLEWISQVIQQDVTFYYNRYLLASSNRELFSAGLLPEQMSGQSYVDLFLKGQKYSINEASIGKFRFLNVSGRIYTGRYRDEVITIPFLLDERSVQEEITELREYMILVGAGLVLLAVLLGYFLANRFSRPVEVLIRGTGEMSRGNLQYRIQEKYRDEFRQLVSSFNHMAASLDEQKSALEGRRAYIENILNHITTSVVSVDNTMNIATYNPAAVNLFQMPASYQGSLQDMIPGNHEWNSVREAVQEFVANQERFSLREVALRKGEEEIHLRMVYVPLYFENRWNGALLLVEDITDIIRSNRFSAWAEMARRVAHEVKNPLTPIQLSIEHLTKVYKDGSENFAQVLNECSETILKQVKALRRLVSDFSIYGKPSALNKSNVDPEAFLKDLVSSYRLPQGITVEAQIDEDLPVLKIDADKVRGALMNIIENGLQAMNGSGRIFLKAEKTEDSSVRIQIRDTGRGVPPEIVPRLFEPYFSTKTGGTGLGLAIARKNIEDNGGKIQVESKEGKGTTVTVELPIASAS